MIPETTFLESPSNKENEWETLPGEIRDLIFSYLPVRDLCFLSSVSKEFKSRAESPNLWQSMWVRDRDYWHVCENVPLLATQR